MNAYIPMSLYYQYFWHTRCSGSRGQIGCFGKRVVGRCYGYVGSGWTQYLHTGFVPECTRQKSICESRYQSGGWIAFVGHHGIAEAPQRIADILRCHAATITYLGADSNYILAKGRKTRYLELFDTCHRIVQSVSQVPFSSRYVWRLTEGPARAIHSLR
jgi:hypothetical protein